MTKLVDGHVKIFAVAGQNLSRFNLDSFGLDISEVRITSVDVQSDRREH